MALEMLIDILTWMNCACSIHRSRQVDHWSEGHRGWPVCRCDPTHFHRLTRRHREQAHSYRSYAMQKNAATL